MATKKELEERIAALEVEIAILKAQTPVKPIMVLPRPSDVPWPQQDHYPFGWPKVWCSGGSVSSPTRGGPGTISFNAVPA